MSCRLSHLGGVLLVAHPTPQPLLPPRAAVREDVLRESSAQSRCPWKGLASYFSLEVNGQTNPDTAWYYPEPSEAAKNIDGHVAFWQGVEVS